ncbi:hypothetical protein M8C21_003357, partial [Ambrosia artemisiifolia]
MGNNVVLMLISFLLIISSSSGDDSPDFRDALGRRSFLPPKNTGSKTPITPSGMSTENTGNGLPQNFEENMNRFEENMNRFAENMTRFAENMNRMKENMIAPPPPPPDPSVQDYDKDYG